MNAVYADAGRYYFACRVRHVLSIDALGLQAEHYARDYPRRQVEFLNCLINPQDDRLTFDLRFVSQPDPVLYIRGRIGVALIVRMDGGTPEAAERYSAQFLHVLQAIFEEYTFELAPTADLAGFLAPFPVRQVATITRRAGWELLDTVRPGSRRRKRLGFTAEPATPLAANPSGSAARSPSNAVFHVFPFIPTYAPFTTLFQLMLLEAAPMVVSCRLRPTTLRPEEEAWIEEEIARCERAAQTGLGSPSDDLVPLRPALQEQAREYERYLSRLLFGLKANAALMTLEVGSLVDISVPLLDALGGLITEPAGGTRGDNGRTFSHYLSGGYEVRCHGLDSGASRNCELLDLTVPAHPFAPAGAERFPYLFDSLEGSALFRFPPATLELAPGLDVRSSRTQPPPRDLPADGCFVGRAVHGNAVQSVRIRSDDRRRHVYVVGQTGTGKTTVLKSMILDDMRAGAGLCVIDPHGDLFKELLGKVPKNRVKDVVLIDPTDRDFPVGLNMLEYETDDQRHFLVQELVGMITRLIQDEYQTMDVAGPIFFQHMRMNLLLVMSNPADPGTLLDFYSLYHEKDNWRRWLPLQTENQLLKQWVEHVLPRQNYLAPGSDSSSMGGYVGSKFDGFVFDPMLRNIFGQKRSTIDLGKIMNEGKILLVNLAKGELTEANARFFGMVLMAKLMAAAMARVRIPERERRDFNVYVDEFQSLATQSFVTLLSEARKFGLSLVLANQFVEQIKDARIVQGIFGNVGTVISVRVGPADG